VSALKRHYAWKDFNFSFIYEITIDVWYVKNKTRGFYELGQGHCVLRLRSRSLWGFKLSQFDVNKHIGRYGRVCSETYMHERIIF
jgi:hypothetical protein